MDMVSVGSLLRLPSASVKNPSPVLDADDVRRSAIQEIRRLETELALARKVVVAAKDSIRCAMYWKPLKDAVVDYDNRDNADWDNT